jgi:hypothetical protein
VLAGQNVGMRQVNDRIWLVSFMDYDLGYFDDEVCRLEPIANPFRTCDPLTPCIVDNRTRAIYSLLSR